jgi:hypothetical protein
MAPIAKTRSVTIGWPKEHIEMSAKWTVMAIANRTLAQSADQGARFAWS